jgi:hypothetical protein
MAAWLMLERYISFFLSGGKEKMGQSPEKFKNRLSQSFLCVVNMICPSL